MKRNEPPEATSGPKGPAQRVKPLRRRGAARSIQEHAPELAGAFDLLDHPDGWYWVAANGRQQFGPFETAEMARADRDRVSEESVNEAETEREAEQELGIDDAVREEIGSRFDNTDP